MRFRTKNLIKKIALVLAGVAAITAVGFGVKAIVDYTKEDLETISPKFEVGNLGADGKFVDDETTLYTKEAFGCYGLQVKPDFDSEVNYQIFYYDILDNYVSSTTMLSDGFSGEAPVNGAYARMVIEPRDDEDNKISWTEKISYPKQLTVKVKKEQDIEKRFTSFKGRIMQVVSSVNDSVFTNHLSFNSEKLDFVTMKDYCVTSTTLLSVEPRSTLTFSPSKLSESYHNAFVKIFEFKDLPLENNYFSNSSTSGSEFSFTFDKNTKYVIILIDQHTPAVEWTDAELLKLPSCFSITKTN